MGNDRQGASGISPFLNNSQRHHTCKNLQDNKRHTGVNEMTLPWQLLLRTWRRWGFLCFTQAAFSPLVPSYWEGYISQAGWMDGWMDGVERSRPTAHFIPGVTDHSRRLAHYFYKISAYLLFRQMFWGNILVEIHAWLNLVLCACCLCLCWVSCWSFHPPNDLFSFFFLQANSPEAPKTCLK